ncbi:hypothetical protein [Prochlorococcus marinus]|uniref:Putative Carbon storage regulator n=1 Tax=Prochlorococcus marinus str. PAC1 TaxID=59924 RepID=A0A0A2C0K4_PROMR|nr:hypothetical protein [Prochlorococcus marinus]KGG18440.1 putative Carbon storage regulator [Prochlorococcus marinus str. PAC1]
MFRKLLVSSFFFIGLIGSGYPTEKENTKLFDYCFSLEKILIRNSLVNRQNVSGEIKIISKALASVGMDNSRGDLTKKIIDQYKTSDESILVSFVPTKLYCLSGYWIEKFRPGRFESIVYESSKDKIEEFYDEYGIILRNDVSDLMNDLNRQYKTIKKEFNQLFD